MLMNMTMSVSGQVTGGRQCNKMCMFELAPALYVCLWGLGCVQESILFMIWHELSAVWPLKHNKGYSVIQQLSNCVLDTNNLSLGVQGVNEVNALKLFESPKNNTLAPSFQF